MSERRYQAVFDASTVIKELEARMEAFQITIESRDGNKYIVRAIPLKMHRFSNYPTIKYYMDLGKATSDNSARGPTWIDEAK